MKLWNLRNESQIMYAVAYGDTLQDAINRTCREINEKGRAEYTDPGKWDGEEWDSTKYGGVLLFV